MLLPSLSHGKKAVQWLKSLTELAPSKIAQHVSEGASAAKAILIDCFAGVGGNSIAFALSDRWKKVYAIEKDPRALACAQHNAQLYGVHDKISWYLGDCFEVIAGQLRELHQAAVLFASPPWGGRLTRPNPLCKVVANPH